MRSRRGLKLFELFVKNNNLLCLTKVIVYVLSSTNTAIIYVDPFLRGQSFNVFPRLGRRERESQTLLCPNCDLETATLFKHPSFKLRNQIARFL